MKPGLYIFCGTKSYSVYF